MSRLQMCFTVLQLFILSFTSCGLLLFVLAFEPISLVGLFLGVGGI